MLEIIHLLNEFKGKQSKNATELNEKIVLKDIFKQYCFRKLIY